MIELKNVTKFFKTEGAKKYILRNVTFSIPEGKNIGILGRNGAGKSTLLRMLGGIDFPNSGEIKSNKSFSWPMGLGGGFQGSMTGRQNVKFVCRIYGKSDGQVKRAIESIKEFAELGDYFDMPMHTCSSGMKSRLGFGLSLAFDFDYLIIDETLSVGDENFRKKASAALKKKIETCNVLLVSHSMQTLREICEVGIVVNDGQIYYYDNINDAIEAYHQINLTNTNTSTKEKASLTAPASSAIYCDDGKVFDNINDAAVFYKIRPMSITQALEKNSGSNVFLKKVFWRDGHEQLSYQSWQNVVPQSTIIASDGVIFEDAKEASYFYMDRMPNRKTDIEHVEQVMSLDGFSKELNVKFYYLSEYK